MNSFELNKVLGAVLGTCLILLALNIGAGAIFSVEKPAKPGYAIAVKEEAGKEAAPKEKEQPIEVLLASASADKGKSIARQCQACHTFEKGGPNRVGPNLWNIVGSERGEGRGGFDFSDAMKKKGGTWTYEELNKFLADPRSYIPGTKMTFAGIKRDDQRADVIAYLHTLSDNPKPLPTAAAAPAAPEGGAAPAAKPSEAPKARAPAGQSGQSGQAPAAQPAQPAKPAAPANKPNGTPSANAPAGQPAQPAQPAQPGQTPAGGTPAQQPATPPAQPGTTPAPK